MTGINRRFDTIERVVGQTAGQVDANMATLAHRVATHIHGATISEDFEDTTYDLPFTGTWARANDQAHGGSWSLKSASIGNNATTDAVMDVPPGAREVRFWYKVSSEAGWDFFRLLVDGAEVFRASGTVGWVQSAAIDVEGASTVTFRYTKDAGTVAGSDASWVDDVVFSIGARISAPADRIGHTVFTRLAVDKTRTSTTTLTAEDQLNVPVVADATYVTEGYFLVSSASNTPDFKGQLNGPAGVHSFTVHGLDVAATGASGSLFAFGGAIVFQLAAVSNSCGYILKGLYRPSASGSYGLDWSQNTSNATATTLKADSWLKLTRVA